MRKSKWPRIKWNQSCAELANRPFADLFKDYQGESTMTPDDYAIKFCNSNDVPFATDGKKYRALVKTIAAAIAAEREECAKLAESQEDDFIPSYEYADMDRDEASGYRQACHSIADAIRARK